VLVGTVGVIEPLLDKGLGDRLQHRRRVGTVADLEKLDGLFDEPLESSMSPGRLMAVPIASLPIACGKQAWACSRTGAGSTGVRRRPALV
jgi:hypothetical protein